MEIIYWTYKLNTNKTPSSNIKSLLYLLRFKTLEFITRNALPKEVGPNYKYTIHDVSMTGEVSYVKPHLVKSINSLKGYLKLFVDSDESFETKTYELLLARTYIKEFLLTNNIHDLVLLDSDFVFNLSSIKDLMLIPVRYDQCKFTGDVTTKIEQHLHLRHSYISLLDNYLAIELDRLNLSLLEEKQKIEKKNTKKEIQLLDVWVSLKEAGFIDFHSKSKLKLSEHRKRFFELFQLTDRNFNDRNNNIKARKIPSEFLGNLDNIIKRYGKKKK